MCMLESHRWLMLVKVIVSNIVMEEWTNPMRRLDFVIGAFLGCHVLIFLRSFIIRLLKKSKGLFNWLLKSAMFFLYLQSRLAGFMDKLLLKCLVKFLKECKSEKYEKNIHYILKCNGGTSIMQQQGFKSIISILGSPIESVFSLLCCVIFLLFDNWL